MIVAKTTVMDLRLVVAQNVMIVIWIILMRWSVVVMIVMKMMMSGVVSLADNNFQGTAT